MLRLISDTIPVPLNFSMLFFSQDVAYQFFSKYEINRICCRTEIVSNTYNLCHGSLNATVMHVNLGVTYSFYISKNLMVRRMLKILLTTCK